MSRHRWIGILVCAEGCVCGAEAALIGAGYGSIAGAVVLGISAVLAGVLIALLP